MREDASTSRPDAAEIKRLLARVPVVRSACDLDLLTFLSRHPRVLLTMEQLASFAGYEMKQVARSMDAFLQAGLLERTQNPKHAARMYLLVVDGPWNEGPRALLELSSTRQGRREILDLLEPGGSSAGGRDAAEQSETARNRLSIQLSATRGS